MSFVYLIQLLLINASAISGCNRTVEFAVKYDRYKLLALYRRYMKLKRCNRKFIIIIIELKKIDIALNNKIRYSLTFCSVIFYNFNSNVANKFMKVFSILSQSVHSRDNPIRRVFVSECKKTSGISVMVFAVPPASAIKRLNSLSSKPTGSRNLRRQHVHNRVVVYRPETRYLSRVVTSCSAFSLKLDFSPWMPSRHPRTPCNM